MDVRPRLAVGELGSFGGLLCILLLAVPPAHAQFRFGDDPRAESGDAFGSVVARGDFNGDGYTDLAVGMPWEDVSNGAFPIVDAGAVEVIYGTSSGLASANRQFWRQGSANVEDVAEAGELFGHSLAAGDFNRDGYDDLAIGVPRESGRGAVNVLYGSALGLSATTIADQFWHQDSPDVENVAEVGDGFGSSLATGDFNGDRYDDLAIGVPGEDLYFGTDPEGAVNVLYGSALGLSATIVPDQFWHQDITGIQDLPEARDYFGSSLTAGDFNADGRDDLAIGIPGEDPPIPYPGQGYILDGGAVAVLYGFDSLGLSAAANQFWHQNSPDVEDYAESDDRFGESVAAGDFDGDGADDLAIGVPAEDISSHGWFTNPGAVHVIYGSAGLGLSATASADQFWHQDSPGVAGALESLDHFGWSLAVGNFDRDQFDDLAIGVPRENVGSITHAGTVNVIYGSAVGLSATVWPLKPLWNQDSPDMDGAAEAGDYFGGSVMWGLHLTSLAAGDFNGDGADDLAVGVPGEDLYGAGGAIDDAGAVNVIHGSGAGLSATVFADQFWTQSVILPPFP